eukprot:15353070-Ditylum_brightwellii.AAC.1
MNAPLEPVTMTLLLVLGPTSTLMNLITTKNILIKKMTWKLQQMMRVSRQELKSRKTARESFKDAMEYPMQIVKDHFEKLDIDGCPVEV